MKTDYSPTLTPHSKERLFKQTDTISITTRTTIFNGMAGNKKADTKASKAGDKTSSNAKGGSKKDDKAGDASSSKLKPATSINTRHILVHIVFYILFEHHIDSGSASARSIQRKRRRLPSLGMGQSSMK